jgi:GT2 family glycosyltransferase
MSAVSHESARASDLQPGPTAAVDPLRTPVTVTVVNYNGKAFIEDCLDALAALEGEVVEILVIDNASTDGSLDLIRRRAPAVRLIELECNGGPCAARNVGLREASTDWVFQIDSDVIVRPDTLLELLPETGLPGVAVVQPRAVLAHDPSVVHYDGGSMHYVGVMCLDNLLARVDGVASEPEDVDAVISMALLLHRGALLDAGGWDEAFFILFEDHDVSYRLRARGHRLRRVPGAVVLHREGTEGISYRPGAVGYPGRRAFLHARNRPYLVLKNYSWAAIFLSLPGRFAYACVWAAFAASRGVFLDYLKGRWALIKLVPRALRLRRDTALHRVVGDGCLLGCRDLTFSPVIQRKGMEAGLIRLLNGMLSAWWAAAGRLLPRGSGTPDKSAQLSGQP